MNNLSTCYYSLGRVDEALELMQEVYVLRSRSLGADHPHTITSMNNLAVVLEGAGRREEALPYFEQSLVASETTLGVEHPDTLLRLRNLANCSRDCGQGERALKLYAEYVTRNVHRHGEGSVGHGDALVYLGFNQVKLERWAEAEPVLRECLEIRERFLASDDWRIPSVKSLLGAALVGLGRLGEAEPLLLAGYLGQAARRDGMRDSARIGIDQALERLIAFYEGRGEPGDEAEAEKWRARRDG